MYAFRERIGPVELAFTDRLGGVSAAPYDELNLALEGGDDPAATSANLARVVADFAPDLPASRWLAEMRQVHGTHVDVVDDRRASGVAVTADAMVASEPGVVLVVRVADCVPVLLADPDRGVVGVAHAGRRGMADGVVPAAVSRMRDLGAGPLRAWVGPSICGHCYEVPQALRDEVAAVEPAAASTTSWGTPALDVSAGVRAQLERDGVEVSDVGRCTLESPDLYSYRRDGDRAGRLAGLVRWVG